MKEQVREHISRGIDTVNGSKAGSAYNTDGNQCGPTEPATTTTITAENGFYMQTLKFVLPKNAQFRSLRGKNLTYYLCTAH